MAGPGGIEAGRIAIRVLPDTSNFATSLQKYLQRIESRLQLKIPVNLDTDGLAADLAAIKATVQANRIQIPVDVDAGGAVAAAAAAQATVQKSVSRRKIQFNFGLDGVKKLGSAIGVLAGARIGQIQAIFQQITLLIARAAASAALLGPPILLAAAGALTLAPAVAAIIPALLAAGAVVATVTLGIRDLAKAFEPLGKAFDGLQDRLGRILSRGVRPLVKAFATQLRPVLRAGLTDVAGILNRVLRQFLRFAASAEAMGALKAIFAAVNASLRTILPAVVPLTRAFLQITVAALPGFQILIRYLTDLALRFAAFIGEASKSGQMQSAITTAVNGVIGVIRVAGGIFGEFLGLLRSLQPIAGPVFSFLGQALQVVVRALSQGVTAAVGFARGIDFTPVTAGAQQAAGAFQQVRSTVQSALLGIAQAVLPVVLQIGRAVGPGLASLVGSLGSAFQTIQPAIQAFVAAVGPVLGRIAVQIGQVLGPALADIGQIIQTQVAPAFAALLRALAPVAAFLLNILGNALVGALKGAVSIIKGVLTILAGLFNVIAGLLTGDWGRLWEGLKQIVAGAWRAILGLVEFFLNVGILRVFRLGLAAVTALWRVGLNGLRAGWAALGRGLQSLASGMWSGIKGLFRSGVSALGSLAKSGWTAARNAFSSGISAVLGLVRRLPGQILSALGRFNNLLVSVGRNLIMGLVSGIRGAAGAAVSAAKGVVSDAVSGAKNLLGIKSPSKKANKEIGVPISRGIAQGITKGGAAVQSALNTLINAVVRTKDKSALRVAQAFERQLLALSRQREAVIAKVADATKKLAELQEQSAQYIAGVRDSFLQLGDISQIDNPTNFRAIYDRLTAQVRAATDFARLTSTLRNMGLNTTTLTQLINAGPERALAAAQQLVNAGTAGVRTVNGLVAQLARAGKATGQAGSDALYGAGVDAAKGLVAGLKSQQAELVKAMQGLGKAMVDAIRKDLRIKSPSQVFADEVGRWIPLGVAAGIDSEASAVTSRVAKLASVSASRFSGFDTAGAAAGAGVAFNGPVYTYDPDELARRIQTRQRDALALHGVTATLLTA